MNNNQIKLAVVGVGDWGKNIARNYHQVPECDLKYVCDLDKDKLAKLQPQLSGTTVTTNINDLLADSDLDAIAIATVAPTHHELAKSALMAGKHVYVEKPFTLKIHHAIELIQLADALFPTNTNYFITFIQSMFYHVFPKFTRCSNDAHSIHILNLLFLFPAFDHCFEF